MKTRLFCIIMFASLTAMAQRDSLPYATFPPAPDHYSAGTSGWAGLPLLLGYGRATPHRSDLQAKPGGTHQPGDPGTYLLFV